MALRGRRALAFHPRMRGGQQAGHASCGGLQPHLALPPLQLAAALAAGRRLSQHASSFCRLQCAQLSRSSSTVPSRFESTLRWRALQPPACRPRPRYLADRRSACGCRHKPRMPPQAHAMRAAPLRCCAGRLMPGGRSLRRTTPPATVCHVPPALLPTRLGVGCGATQAGAARQRHWWAGRRAGTAACTAGMSPCNRPKSHCCFPPPVGGSRLYSVFPAQGTFRFPKVGG